MIKRIVDIAKPAYVHMKNAQLLIEHDKVVIGSIPIEDLGVVILQHPAIVITQAVVIACQQNNVAMVFCDERHLPYSLILPIGEGNTLHQKVLRLQVATKKPVTNRIWKQIVQQKIAEQERTLLLAGVKTTLLGRLVSKVKSGDTENHEAQAAQHYWPRLFGKSFRRDYEAVGVNALLNYGYAVVRALVARAIVAGGLHPALGIHHHNQYNALCLADDLMEPFRPWVDLVVYQIWMENKKVKIDQHNKQNILGLLSESVQMNKKTMPMMTACHYLVADFKRCLEGALTSIKYPALASRVC